MSTSLIDAALKRLKLRNSSVSVGFFASATYAATADRDEEFVANVAYDNNFGNGAGTPPRPFMAVVDESDKKTKYAKIFGAQLSRGYSDLDALATVGDSMMGDIRKRIISLRTPPNAQSTIDAKGSSNPLVDTGHMRDSVTYEVD